MILNALREWFNPSQLVRVRNDGTQEPVKDFTRTRTYRIGLTVTMVIVYVIVAIVMVSLYQAANTLSH